MIKSASRNTTFYYATVKEFQDFPILTLIAFCHGVLLGVKFNELQNQMELLEVGGKPNENKA